MVIKNKKIVTFTKNNEIQHQQKEVDLMESENLIEVSYPITEVYEGDVYALILIGYNLRHPENKITRKDAYHKLQYQLKRLRQINSRTETGAPTVQDFRNNKELRNDIINRIFDGKVVVQSKETTEEEAKAYFQG